MLHQHSRLEQSNKKYRIVFGNTKLLELVMTHSAEWYFDFISPFSYLQFKHFGRLPDTLEIRLVPVLFAGLLNHWGQKGPAEIPAKRIEMYRYCHWCAQQHGIPFKTPPAHPFNPLKVLRLAIALNANHNAVSVIFDHIWGDGNDIHTNLGFQALASGLGVNDAENLVASDTVKKTLRDNTERAVSVGVYGIPTFVINDALFWGFDRTDMLLEYLNDPSLLQTPEMLRLASVPSAAERSR